MPDVAITVWRMPTSSLTAFLLSGPEGDLVLGWADTAAQSPGIATRIAPPAQAAAATPTASADPPAFPSPSSPTPPCCRRAARSFLHAGPIWPRRRSANPCCSPTRAAPAPAIWR
ncbi:Uncharacterised protein [Chromobacterium violaceum]|uniref:Uncharacterized protein n=1 Tax=Chromobacterium violaceum TaxID=536 RepID=A0A447T9E5_CHRVL|nr:Uncharacterised protein [Chromobacterium violaceum]